MSIGALVAARSLASVQSKPMVAAMLSNIRDSLDRLRRDTARNYLHESAGQFGQPITLVSFNCQATSRYTMPIASIEPLT